MTTAVPGAAGVTPPAAPAPRAKGRVAALLWRWRHRWRPGTLFGAYLILAGAERFLVEFVRRNDAILLGLTQPQVFSIVMIAGGAAFLWLRRGAPAGDRDPAASAGGQRGRRASSAGA